MVRGPDSDKAELASGQSRSSGLEQEFTAVQAQKGPSQLKAAAEVHDRLRGQARSQHWSQGPAWGQAGQHY